MITTNIIGSYKDFLADYVNPIYRLLAVTVCDGINGLMEESMAKHILCSPAFLGSLCIEDNHLLKLWDDDKAERWGIVPYRTAKSTVADCDCDTIETLRVSFRMTDRLARIFADRQCCAPYFAVDLYFNHNCQPMVLGRISPYDIADVQFENKSLFEQLTLASWQEVSNELHEQLMFVAMINAKILAS